MILGVVDRWGVPWRTWKREDGDFMHLAWEKVADPGELQGPISR